MFFIDRRALFCTVVSGYFRENFVLHDDSSRKGCLPFVYLNYSQSEETQYLQIEGGADFLC